MNAAAIESDYAIWDNREDVTYYAHATAGDQAYALTAPDGNGAAKRRPLKWKEMAASAGVYTGQDRVWLIPHVLLPAALQAAGLKASDRVRDPEGNDWTVLESERVVWGTVWKLTARNLVIQANLRDQIDIQRPAVALNGAGATVRTWPGTVAYASLACRIQPIRADVATERAIRGFKATHEIYLSQQVALLPDDRVKDVATGAIYAIRGYSKPSRIDELPLIEAELTP